MKLTSLLHTIIVNTTVSSISVFMHFLFNTQITHIILSFTSDKLLNLFL